MFAQTVLMHLDMARAAAEWARVLRPGGRVVVLEPIAGNPLVGAYRRWLSPYRDTDPRYVTVAELAAASSELELREHEEHYLLSVAALGLPGPLARLAARPLGALDECGAAPRARAGPVCVDDARRARASLITAPARPR